MAAMKKNGAAETETNLKREDSRRYSTDSGVSILHSTVAGKKKISEIFSGSDGSGVKVRKKLPVAVDIIVGVIMILLVVGVIVGSYMLFRYYSNDYDSVDVTYTALYKPDEGSDPKDLKGKELYLDTAGNTVYFGKITGVSYEEGNTGKVKLIVSVSARYRQGEGYSLGDSRLAVGASFNLRCVDQAVAVAIVTLNGGK